MAKKKLIGGDLAKRICMDVGNRVDPEDSKVDYGPEEMAFRQQIQKDYDDYCRKHPNAILDIKE